jgi:4'-phosphopantetheinyl transferase
MFAFAMRSPVGVDVEIVRTNIACEEIAQRYFSRQEAAELRAAPRQLQAEAFFLCWTRKEAYVKARGEGLQIPLDSFNVSLLPGTPPRLESVDSSQWCLHSFRPHERYVGALVTSRKQCQVRYWDWVPTSSAGCPNEAQ